MFERIKRDVAEHERESAHRELEERTAESLKSELARLGFAVTRDDHFPAQFGDRVIELARGYLRIRLATDRGDWYLEAAGRDGEWYPVDLWCELIDCGPAVLEDLSFVRAVHYLAAALEKLQTLSDDHDFASTAARLGELAFDRAERLFPGLHVRLQERLGQLADELPEVTVKAESRFDEYARNGVPFAVYSDGAVELRLGPEIAEAAVRTPDTAWAPRGQEWVRFAPSEWDRHATDRLEAWFRSAWRAAASKG